MKELFPYYKNIMRLAGPVIISQVGSMSVSFADTLMVGQLGEVQLAAVAFANSLSYVIYLFGMGLAMGLTPLVSKSLAENNIGRINSLYKNSLVLNTVLGVVFALLIGLLALNMQHMGQDPAILPYARGYIFYQVLSALPFMLHTTAKQFLEGLGNTMNAMVIMVTGNILNIILNWALIYGEMGFPEMGAAGAGASTFISRVYMVILFAFILLYKPKYKTYTRDMLKSSMSKFRVRRLLNIGAPIAGQLSIEMGAFSLMAIVIGTIGASQLAAHNIANNITATVFMVVTGIASATTIIISKNYGLGLYEPIRKTMRASIHIVVLLMIVSAIGIIALAAPIASIFIDNPQVISIASSLLVFGSVWLMSDGIQGVILGGLRGIMIVKQPMYYAILVYIIIGLPLGYMLTFYFDFGAQGTWTTFIVALTFLAALYSVKFRREVSRLERGGVKGAIATKDLPF